MQETFNDALNKRDQQNEARFNQFAQVLQQVVDKLNSVPEQRAGLLGTVDKGAIADKVMDKLLSKLSGEDTDPQFDDDFRRYKVNINQLQGLAIRRANKAIDNILQRELKGLSSASTNIAARQIEDDLASHGPV